LPKPGRSSAPVTVSDLKPSAALWLKGVPQTSPISGERFAPAPIAAPAFRNCRELSSGPRPRSAREPPARLIASSLRSWRLPVFAWEEQSPALPFFLPSIQRARCWALQGVSHANGAKTFWTSLGRECNACGHPGRRSVGLPAAVRQRYPDDMRWMREEVRHQKYRYDPRSPDWVGLALAKHLGLDPRADRKKLNAILRAWYANGVLAAEIQRRGCATSGNTWFPEIGTMIPMPPDSTASVAMRERALKTHTE